MPNAPIVPAWTCPICALKNDILYEPPLSPDARCNVCGDPPGGCDMLRFDVAGLRRSLEELKSRMSHPELRLQQPTADLMTAHEASEFLRLPSVRALYQQVRRGRVKAQRLGRQLRFSRAELSAIVGAK